MKLSKNLASIVLIAIISLACTVAESEEIVNNEINVTDSIVGNVETQNDFTFELLLDLEKLDEKQYNLLATMQLDEGAYYGSPHSNNSFGGLFNIEIADNDQIILGDTLIETPFPPEVEDQFSDEKVRWVKEETNYMQSLGINSTEDFTVNGVVSFVVEPVCNRHEVAFEITSKAGTLTISQEKPIIANISN